MKARKAVILTNGSRTGMLPITSIVPKELLPICGRPVIEHVVKEVVAAGIEEVILVISKDKESVANYFKQNEKLKEQLERDGHTDALEELHRIWNMIKITTVYQDEQSGIGGALLAAKEAVGNEPFAVLISDNIIQTDDCSSYIAQLITAFSKYGRSVAGVQELDSSIATAQVVFEEAVFEGREFDNTMFNGQRVITKPTNKELLSCLNFCGRFVFKPEIFHLLEQTQSDTSNPNRLTEAINQLLQSDGLLGSKLEGECYHIGDAKELLLANLSLTEFRCQ